MSTDTSERLISQQTAEAYNQSGAPLIIRGGLVYDGSGSLPYIADLLLHEGRIKDIGQIEGPRAAWVIDAGGQCVTPGFIDAHRHADFAVFTDETCSETLLAQGITSMIVGNCGMSAAPIGGVNQESWYTYIEPCLGKPAHTDRVESFDAYLHALDQLKLPIHTGAMVGMGTVLASIRGFDDHAWTAAERSQVSCLLLQALDAGAIGISCGLMYRPEMFASSEDYIQMLKPAAAYGRPLTCHMRSEGDGLLRSVQEVIDIAKKADLSLNISHFKVFGKSNWQRTLPKAIDLIDKARQDGQDITVDFYPYDSGSTTLLTLIPPVCMKAALEQTLEFLSSRTGTELLRREIMRKNPDWDNMVESIGWDRVIISSVITEKNRGCLGRSLTDITADGHDEDETACLIRLLCEEKGRVAVIVRSMSQEDVDRVALLPYASVISDSLYGAPDHPHPRLNGAFPRIWQELVLKRKLLTPQQAIHKMTSLPAKRYGLTGRGLLQIDKQADVVIFDPSKLSDRATYDNPREKAAGIDKVLTDGQIVWNKGKRFKGACASMIRAR